MRTGNVLISAIHLFFSLFIIGMGAFFIALPHAPHIRFLISSFFVEKSSLMPLAGYAILMLGFILLVGFGAMNRGRYYRIAMRRHKTSVDLKVIKDYVDIHWKKLFPRQDLSIEVLLLPQGKLEVMAEIPSTISLKQQRDFLKKTEKELGAIFADNLGYEKEFLVTLVIK